MLGAPSAVFGVLISYSPRFPTSLFSLPPYKYMGGYEAKVR